MSLSQVFVSAQEREAWLRQQGIIFYPLKNGIKIVALARGSKDSVFTSINFHFLSGAFFDPPKQKGLHHLLEHVILSNFFWEQRNRNDTQINAITWPLRLTFEASGPVSLTGVQFGLLEAIEPLVVRLMKFAQGKTSQEFEKVFAREKEVVSREIEEKNNDYQHQLALFLTSLIFAPDNPVNASILGTKESLSRSSSKSLVKLAREVLIGSNLIVSILTESSEEVIEKTVKKLTKLLNQLPRGKKKRPWPKDKEKKLNSKVKPGKIYYQINNLRPDFASLIAFYQLRNISLFTPLGLALKRLIERTKIVFISLVRQRGLSYSPFVRLRLSGGRAGGLVLGLNFNPRSWKRQGQERLISEFRALINQTWAVFDQNLVQQIINVEQRRQKTTPLAASTLLDWLLWGLFRYQRFIAGEKVKRLFAQIGSAEIDYWLNYFRSQVPTIALFGDLAKLFNQLDRLGSTRREGKRD